MLMPSPSKKYYRYAIKMNRHKISSELKRAVFNMVEHLFGNHNDCDISNGVNQDKYKLQTKTFLLEKTLYPAHQGSINVKPKSSASIAKSMNA